MRPPLVNLSYLISNYKLEYGLILILQFSLRREIDMVIASGSGLVQPRINTGVCESDMGAQYRITTEYQEGRGDRGTSNTALGLRTDKSDPSYAIHVATERLRLALSAVSKESRACLPEEEVRVLDWLNNSTFSISSFCYLVGGTTKHCLPEEFLVYMEGRIAEWKAVVGPAQDFLIWHSGLGTELDACRVSARELEREFRLWVKREQVGGDKVERMGAILNRLSSYILWLTRYVYKELGMVEQYWTGAVSKFPM